MLTVSGLTSTSGRACIAIQALLLTHQLVQAFPFIPSPTGESASTDPPASLPLSPLNRDRRGARPSEDGSLLPGIPLPGSTAWGVSCRSPWPAASVQSQADALPLTVLGAHPALQMFAVCLTPFSVLAFLSSRFCLWLAWLL